jgi:hypothetical protein
MMINYPKPNWWTLFAILPLMVGLFAVESQLALPTLGHQIALIGIVFVFVGLVGLWTMANAVALAYDDAPHMTFMDLTADDRLNNFGDDEAELQPAGWPEAEPQIQIAARSGKRSGAPGLSQERYN